MPLLDIRDLHAGYGRIEVLHGINLTVNQDDYIAVVGANGAGKTTLLKAISGTLRPVHGVLQFDGHDLRSRQAHQIPALGIAHVPEGRQIFPALTVQDNLVVGAWLRRDGAQRRESLDMILSLFPRLAERSRQLAGTLSGGEQQMLAVGRALMLRPRLLMLDEPSQGLAPKVVTQLYEQLRAVHAAGTAILLVEQNTIVALTYAARAYVLEHGRITLSGSSADLRGSDEIRQAYLGI